MRKTTSRDLSVRVSAKRGTRDWRLAALGTSCCTLGVACLTLVACSSAPHRPVAPAPAPPVMIEKPVASTP